MRLVSMPVPVVMLTKFTLCKSMRTNSANMEGGKPLEFYLSKRMLEHY